MNDQFLSSIRLKLFHFVFCYPSGTTLLVARLRPRILLLLLLPWCALPTLEQRDVVDMPCTASLPTGLSQVLPYNSAYSEYYHCRDYISSRNTAMVRLVWNVKGLRSPQKRMKVLRHLRKLKTDVAMLQETHLHSQDFFRMRKLWMGHTKLVFLHLFPSAFLVV